MPPSFSPRMQQPCALHPSTWQALLVCSQQPLSGTFCADAGIIHEQDTLRQSLHELILDPLLASAMPSQVGTRLLSVLALVTILRR